MRYNPSLPMFLPLNRLYGKYVCVCLCYDECWTEFPSSVSLFRAFRQAKEVSVHLLFLLYYMQSICLIIMTSSLCLVIKLNKMMNTKYCKAWWKFDCWFPMFTVTWISLRLWYTLTWSRHLTSLTSTTRYANNSLYHYFIVILLSLPTKDGPK